MKRTFRRLCSALLAAAFFVNVASPAALALAEDSPDQQTEADHSAFEVTSTKPADADSTAPYVSISPTSRSYFVSDFEYDASQTPDHSRIEFEFFVQSTSALDLTATLTGENADAFQLEGGSIHLLPDNPQQIAVVTPKPGLKAGTYTAQLEVSSAGVPLANTPTASISLTIQKTYAAERVGEYRDLIQSYHWSERSPANSPVLLLYDADALPEGKVFKEWKVLDAEGKTITPEYVEQYNGFCFTMPESNVTVELVLADAAPTPPAGDPDDKPADDKPTDDPVDDPTGPIDPIQSPADAASGIAGGVMIAGALGAAGYFAGTQLYLRTVLPAGSTIPTTRAALALLLWTAAGKPQPAAIPQFADVTAPDTACAAQWAVEQGLLKAAAEGSFQPDRHVTRVQVIRSWNASQR